MSKSGKKYGKRIGFYLGKPIYETIDDQQEQYTFDRIAKSDDNDDGFPLNQLDSDEVLFVPGLIYKKRCA